jgi:hypothetical protein
MSLSKLDIYYQLYLTYQKKLFTLCDQLWAIQFAVLILIQLFDKQHSIKTDKLIFLNFLFLILYNVCSLLYSLYAANAYLKLGNDLKSFINMHGSEESANQVLIKIKLKPDRFYNMQLIFFFVSLVTFFIVIFRHIFIFN